MHRVERIVVYSLLAAALAASLLRLPRADAADPNAAFDFVRVRRIQVVNDAGAVVVDLGGGNNGGYVLCNGLAGETMTYMGASTERNGVVKVWNEDKKVVAEVRSGRVGGGFHAYGGDEKMRAYVGASNTDGSGLLTLHTSSGRLATEIAHTEAGGGLSSFGADGKARTFVGVSSPGGAGAVRVSGASGPMAAELRADKAGGSLAAYGADGKQRVFVGAAGDTGGGLIRVENSVGRLAAVVQCDANGYGAVRIGNGDDAPVAGLVALDAGGSILVSKKDGTIVGRLDARSEGGGLYTMTSAGAPAAFVGASPTTAGAVVLYGKDGKEAERLPR